MAASSPLLRLCILVIFIFSADLAAGFSVGDHHLNWVPVRSTGCQGTIGECYTGDEFEMDSEINRRILATSNYISYQALKRNSVPCSRRGASYYNCKPGAQANPYSRGCNRITRCRS